MCSVIADRLGGFLEGVSSVGSLVDASDIRNGLFKRSYKYSLSLCVLLSLLRQHRDAAL